MSAARRQPEHERMAELHAMHLNFCRHVTVREFSDEQAIVYCTRHNVRPFWPRPARKVVPMTRHEVLNLELVKS